MDIKLMDETLKSWSEYIQKKLDRLGIWIHNQRQKKSIKDRTQLLKFGVKWKLVYDNKISVRELRESPLPFCINCEIRLLLSTDNRTFHCTECNKDYILTENGKEVEFKEAIFRIKRIFRDKNMD